MAHFEADREDAAESNGFQELSSSARRFGRLRGSRFFRLAEVLSWRKSLGIRTHRIPGRPRASPGPSRKLSDSNFGNAECRFEPTPKNSPAASGDSSSLLELARELPCDRYEISRKSRYSIREIGVALSSANRLYSCVVSALPPAPRPSVIAAYDDQTFATVARFFDPTRAGPEAFQVDLPREDTAT